MSDNLQLKQPNSGISKSRDPLIGTTLEGRYLIEEVLGVGGVSVVYKAKQLRFNRYVAVKMIKLQFENNAVYRERFEREIASLSALSHPNIVTVYDCSSTDEQIYVVMDFLKGRSLEALIEQDGPLDVNRFARIAVQVCGALDHAHRNGVIHRDLKPGNIVLMDEELDFVKVVDFGLARLREENRRLTQTGEFCGSPAYMSPEQCRGKPGDERSDVYSLGAVMYEMLTGKDPFYDAGSVLDVLHRHAFIEPRSFAEINMELTVPAMLEAVVQKCLQKEPEARYQTARQVQTDIIEACTSAVGRDATDLLISLAQPRIEVVQPEKTPALQESALPVASTTAPPAKVLEKFLVPALVLLGLLVIFNIVAPGILNKNSSAPPRIEQTALPQKTLPVVSPGKTLIATPVSTPVPNSAAASSTAPLSPLAPTAAVLGVKPASSLVPPSMVSAKRPPLPLVELKKAKPPLPSLVAHKKDKSSSASAPVAIAKRVGADKTNSGSLRLQPVRDQVATSSSSSEKSAPAAEAETAGLPPLPPFPTPFRDAIQGRPPTMVPLPPDAPGHLLRAARKLRAAAQSADNGATSEQIRWDALEKKKVEQ